MFEKELFMCIKMYFLSILLSDIVAITNGSSEKKENEKEKTKILKSEDYIYQIVG